MRLLLRGDANPRLGVGHTVRLLALAEEGRLRGWSVTLAGDLAVEWVRRAFADLDVEVRPGFADGPGLVRAAGGADAVVIDAYALAGDLHGAARQAGVVLANVEDSGFGRRGAHVLVDTQLGAQLPAELAAAASVVLLGPAYALLRCSVRAARAARRHRSPTPGAPVSVLVTMGGTDPGDLTRSVVSALVGTGCRLDVTVLGGAPYDGPVGAVALRQLPPGQDLPGLLAGSDAVVCAAGVTTFEAGCVGVPMALVRAVDNQAAGYRELVGAGLALGLGDGGQVGNESAEVSADLAAWLDDPARRSIMSTRAAELVDGLGARRVLDAVAHVAGWAG